MILTLSDSESYSYRFAKDLMPKPISVDYFPTSVLQLSDAENYLAKSTLASLPTVKCENYLGIGYADSILRNKYVNNAYSIESTNNGLFKTFDSSYININNEIQTKKLQSKSYFTGLNSKEQTKILPLLQNSDLAYNKSLFINDFERYLEKSCQEFNSSNFDNFYNQYVNGPLINIDDFITNLKQYVDTFESGAYGSIEYLNFVYAIERINYDRDLFDNYLNANYQFRLVRSISQIASSYLGSVYSTVPIRYDNYMYFDLIFTIKRDLDNNDLQINIIHNFLNVNKHENKKLNRITAFLN